MKREYPKLLLIVGSALLLSFCFDILFYRKIPGISSPLFFMATLAMSFFLARRFKLSIDVEMTILATLILLSSFMVFIRSSAVLIVLDIITALYLFALLLGRFAGLRLREFVIANYLQQISGTLIQAFREWFWVSKDLFKAKDEFLKNRVILQVGRGFIITLPVITIFILLLSSADLVFSKYITDIIRFFRDLSFVEHATIIAFVATVLTGMLAYAFCRISPCAQGEDIEVVVAGKILRFGFFPAAMLLFLVNITSFACTVISFIALSWTLNTDHPFLTILNNPSFLFVLPLVFTTIFAYTFYRYRLNSIIWASEAGASSVPAISCRLRLSSFTESAILLGSLNILFLIFIVLQFTYLFGGESNIISHGFTYAEYAHRGFFELTAVAFLLFIVIWLTGSKTQKQTTNQKHQFKALAGSLIGMVIIIMVSAFKRLMLYEAVYGFTVLRIYTQVFIAMLAVIFLLFLFKIIINRSEAWFSIRAFTIIIAFIISLNIVNMDRTIARLNIERYSETGNEDLLIYNMSLSEDAINQITGSYYQLAKNKGADSYRLGDARDNLKYRFGLLKESPWQSYNLSRTRALKLLINWEADMDVKSKN